MHVADHGERALLHALHPVARGLAVAPAWPVGLERGLGRLSERGRGGSPSLGQGVASVGDRESVHHGVFPRVGERDGGVGAEADVVPVPVDHDALHPSLRTALGDVEVQGVAVRVRSRRRDGADARRAWFAVCHPTADPTNWCGIVRCGVKPVKTLSRYQYDIKQCVRYTKWVELRSCETWEMVPGAWGLGPGEGLAFGLEPIENMINFGELFDA